MGLPPPYLYSFPTLVVVVSFRISNVAGGDLINEGVSFRPFTLGLPLFPHEAPCNPRPS